MQLRWIVLTIMLLAGSAPVFAAGGATSPDDAIRLAENEPRGMDFDVYIRLRKGMTEGELLQRAGPPDHQTADATVSRSERVRRDNGAGAETSTTTVDEAVRTFYYLPTRANPFTTIVTLAAGRITDLKRERKF